MWENKETADPKKSPTIFEVQSFSMGMIICNLHHPVNWVRILWMMALMSTSVSVFFFFSLNLANWIGFHCGGLRYRQLSSLWWSSKHRGFMHTPRNKLAVRMDWSFVFFSTHPHVLCQTQKESWGWGVRLVSFSVCPPIGLQSVTQLGRCSFRVLFEPSYAVCAIRIV